MRRAAAALAIVTCAAVLAGCSSSEGDADKPSSAVTPASMPLSLMVFNVEYGGTKATDAVIRELQPDVVGVLESYNRLPEIAKAAGYPYYDVGLQLLSKYPILEPSGADGLYAYIEVRPGEAVAMINTHLDYVKDGPNRLERGVPVEEVLESEKEVRLSSIEKLLPAAEALMSDGWPVFLTGDLNEPSHLDSDIAWPVSEAVIGSGMRDSYREVHPDAQTEPGFTWGSVAGGSGSPRRIDYAYVGGPVSVTSSKVVGESTYPDWTSDHRAVLDELTVTPKPIPPGVSLSSRMLTEGDSVTLTYRLPPGSDGGRLAIDGGSSSTHEVDQESGTLALPTTDLPPGPYTVELVSGRGEEVVTNDFYLRPADAQVTLTTDASTYAVGDPITVTWSDGPANRWDWIGVYRASAADPEKDSYLVWGYTGGHDAGALPPSTEGSLVLGEEHQGAPWPLPKGDYVVHYLLTDQYKSAGSATFTVE